MSAHAKYAILRMTKRSRNGPRCRKYHAVSQSRGAARRAICGTRPNIGSLGPKGIHGAKGWGSVTGKTVSCIRCLAMLAKAEGRS
jgi:hypothetical protein